MTTRQDTLFYLVTVPFPAAWTASLQFHLHSFSFFWCAFFDNLYLQFSIVAFWSLVSRSSICTLKLSLSSQRSLFAEHLCSSWMDDKVVEGCHHSTQWPHTCNNANIYCVYINAPKILTKAVIKANRAWCHYREVTVVLGFNAWLLIKMMNHGSLTKSLTCCTMKKKKEEM